LTCGLLPFLCCFPLFYIDRDYITDRQRWYRDYIPNRKTVIILASTKMVTTFTLQYNPLSDLYRSLYSLLIVVFYSDLLSTNNYSNGIIQTLHILYATLALHNSLTTFCKFLPYFFIPSKTYIFLSKIYRLHLINRTLLFLFTFFSTFYFRNHTYDTNMNGYVLWS
jgi:hypothetical protein